MSSTPDAPSLASTFGTPSLQAWKALVEADLAGAPFEKRLVSHTYEGIRLQPLYTHADLDHIRNTYGSPDRLLATLGSADPARTRHGWVIEQERAEADPARCHAALMEDLAGGVGSVLLRLEAASRGGMDADDPRAGTLVASDGVAVSSLADLRTIFDGVHLDMIGVSLEAGAAFVPGAALLAGLWEDRGVAAPAARGAFNADPLAVLARDGSLPYSLDEGLKHMAALARWTADRYPAVTSVRVGTAAYHHAGATATQDLALAMATGLEYLRAMERGGLAIDRAAGQIRFSLAVGPSFFLAIAKLRAARLLWARVVEACGGSPAARRMMLHVRPSKRVLSVRDPWMNILRNTACVFAAGAGGADVISSVPFDATIGPPSEMSRRLARNTHHVLMEECHIHRVADPARGSWYLESLTNELAQRAWIILQAIESRGGMGRALQSGWIAEQIDSAFAPRLKNVATRKDQIVGVSEFANLREHLPTPERVDLELIRAQARERAARTRRGQAGGDASMSGLVGAARGGATMGQMMSLLKTTGSASLAAPIAVHPFAEPFEHLRDAADGVETATGRRPRVFLASIGRTAQHLARTTFARNLFEAGGFEVAGGEGAPDAAAAAAQLAEHHAGVAVICASDEQYPALVPELAPALHRAGARRVVLAGNPGAREAADRAAGVDEFVFVKCDVVRVLRELLEEEGAEL